MWGWLCQSWLLGVADPCTIRVEINPSIVLHQRKFIVIAGVDDQGMTDDQVPWSKGSHHQSHWGDGSVLFLDRRMAYLNHRCMGKLGTTEKVG
jgi:hypothetical protein